MKQPPLRFIQLPFIHFSSLRFCNSPWFLHQRASVLMTRSKPEDVAGRWKKIPTGNSVCASAFQETASVFVFHGSLLTCCSVQITLMNQQSLKRKIKRTEDIRGFYLFLKYYVVPSWCFVKMVNVQFPSCPQRPRPSSQPSPLCVTHHIISVVSADEDKINPSSDTTLIQSTCFLNRQFSFISSLTLISQ